VVTRKSLAPHLDIAPRLITIHHFPYLLRQKKKRNANRSRRKSCQSCAASKIKCDLQLPCSKCTARGRKCEYINDPRITRDKKAAALAAAAASSSRRGSIASSASDASETTSDEASSCASPPPNCASVFPSFGVYKHHHHNRHELADNAQQQQQQQQLQQQYSHLALPSSGPRDYYHQAPDAAAALFDDLYNPTHVSPTLPADLSPLPHGATPLSTYTFPDQLHPHCTYTTGDPVIVAGGASPLHHGASVPEVYSPDVYQTMHYGAGGLSPISISTNLAVYGLYGKAPSTPYVMTPDSTFSSPSTTYGLSAWDSPQELCNTPSGYSKSYLFLWEISF
jgi:hypothetical protein